MNSDLPDFKPVSPNETMTIERIQGTDGIRGPVCRLEESSSTNPLAALLNEGVMTEELFELYTYAYCQELLETEFASVLDLVVIGWDPRDLSGRFNEAAVRGIRKAGLTAVVVDILPTPAISLYQLHVGAACAFVLTASHNPADQHGIKIFLGYSNLKLFPEDDKRLTRRCLSLNYQDIRNAPLLGELRNDQQAARKLFLEFMVDSDNHWLTDNSLAGITIIVDTANGAFSPIISELLKNYKADFVITNSDPSNGINLHSGVADLEGVDFISAKEITEGSFSCYETLGQILIKGREQQHKLRISSNLVLGFVFDGDGDRCFLLCYDPFQDGILVLGGDVQAFFQASFLQQNNDWPQPPLFVNTVESDLEAERAILQAGFETMQCAVGDKWILWQAFYYNWQARQELYLDKITVPKFKNMLEQANSKLEQMIKKSKFDALTAAQIIMSLENWIRENIGEEQVRSAYKCVSLWQNNYFAIGSEESGHVITLAKMSSGDAVTPVFIGNGFKCALNSLAAILALRVPKNNSEFFARLSKPYPSGFQKSLPVYYVDKSLLDEGSVLREELKEMLLTELKWPEMNVEIMKSKEEPEMLLLRIVDNGLPAAAVFVRNSGTEDKLALYLRGRADVSGRLETLAEKVYPFLLSSFKNKTSTMAQAERAVLRCLKDGAKQTSDLMLNNIANISPERLLHEMSSRQKLIQKSGDCWINTELGLTYLKNSERSA
jgi:phosphoglucosamine mutase